MRVLGEGVETDTITVLVKLDEQQGSVRKCLKNMMSLLQENNAECRRNMMIVSEVYFESIEGV